MNEFDRKAESWDQNIMHLDRSEAITNEIIKRFPLNNHMSALEYGAGTGIASFLLKDRLKEITLMDNSYEMVKIMNRKIADSKVRNLKALYFDLEQSDYEVEKFDLIFTQMVLHHVADLKTIIHRFSQLLKPSGFLAIADLYEEDGSFHGEGFAGHNGFNMNILSGILEINGFTKISYSKCFTIDRKISDSDTKKFDVFLLKAQYC